MQQEEPLDLPPAALSYNPSHPDLFKVKFAPGSYASSLFAIKAFKRDEILCFLDHATLAPTRIWSTVQWGPRQEDNIELNSDLVYLNHSCEPNVAFDLTSLDKGKWHARALRDIEPGEPMTFFYPSTEWDMEQSFDCQCGAPTCLGYVSGARYLSFVTLNGRGFINPHIWDLLEANREGKEAGTTCIVQE
jgi:hypothetical protein